MSKTLTLSSRRVGLLLLAIGVASMMPLLAAEREAFADASDCPENTRPVPVLDWNDAPTVTSAGAEFDLALTDDFGIDRAVIVTVTSGTTADAILNPLAESGALVLGTDPAWSTQASPKYPTAGDIGDHYDVTLRLDPAIEHGSFRLGELNSTESVEIQLNGGAVAAQLQIQDGPTTLASTTADDGSLVVWPQDATTPARSGGDVQWSEPVSDITVRLFTRASDTSAPDAAGPLHDGVTMQPVATCLGTGLTVAANLAGSVTQVADRVFDVPLAYRIHNTGNVDLTALQIREDLAALFEPYESLEVRSLTSDASIVNDAYDGIGDPNLLAVGANIPAGTEVTVELAVRVQPSDCRATFASGAVASTELPGGPSNEPSQREQLNASATDAPDPDKPWSFGGCGGLAAAHWISAGPIADGSGNYLVEFTTSITNGGDSEISDVAASSDLNQAFNDATAVRVKSVTGVGLTVNPAYDGSSEIGLLAGTDTLGPGRTGRFVTLLSINPSLVHGPFPITVSATATGPGERPLVDVATDGFDPDPNDDGRSDEDEPTIVLLPQIGVALHQLSEPSYRDDGTYRLELEAVVANTGQRDLEGIQIQAPFWSQLHGVAGLTVTSISSDDLSVNRDFNGSGNLSMLGGTDGLELGEMAAVSIELSIDAGGALGPHLLQAIATGTVPQLGSVSSTTVTDTSAEGRNPDPDNDGETTDNNRRTRLAFPQVGGTLDLIDGPVPTENGYRIRLAAGLINSGATILSDPQIKLPLHEVFGANATVTAIIDVDRDNEFAITLETGYDGNETTSLLEAGGKLPPASRYMAVVEVEIDHAAGVGPFDLSATIAARGAGDTVLTDMSHSGAEPDADGDRVPTNDSEPTRITIPRLLSELVPATTPRRESDGSYTVDLEAHLANAGSASLDSVSMLVDVAAILGPDARFEIVGLESNRLRVNSDFDGASDTELLAGGAVLSIGEGATVTIRVRFNPGRPSAPFALDWNTSAQMLPGSSPISVTTFDIPSEGNPGETNSAEQPQALQFSRIGLSTELIDGPRPTEDDSYSLTYRMTVENSGTTEVREVRVADALGAALKGVDYEVVDVTAAGLTLNPDFDGAFDTAILSGADRLDAGTRTTIDVAVRLIAGSWDKVFEHRATVSAVGPDGTTMSDDSTMGSEPDPDGNHNPLDNAAPMRIAVPHLTMTEALVGGLRPAEKDSYLVDFTIEVSNTGAAVVDELQVLANIPSLADISEIAGERISTDGSITDLGRDALNIVVLETIASDGRGAGALAQERLALLSGKDRLAPGASVLIHLILHADPNIGTSGLISSAAQASAPGPDENQINIATSADHRDGPGAQIMLPKFSVHHSIDQPTPAVDDDGSFLVTPNITVVNEGALTLRSLQVHLRGEDGEQSMIAALGPGLVQVGSVRQSNDGEQGFAGSRPNGPLLFINELEPGEHAMVSPTIRVAASENFSSRTFVGTASASADLGTEHQIIESQGASPLTVSPAILRSTTRLVDGPRPLGDGRYEVAYGINVTNPSAVELANLQLSQTFDETFLDPAVTEVIRVVSDDLTIDGDFDGTRKSTLLQGQDRLAAGASASATVTVRIEPRTTESAFILDAVASASVPTSSSAATSVPTGRDTDDATRPPVTITAPTVDVDIVRRGIDEPTRRTPKKPVGTDLQTSFDLPRFGIASALSEGPVRNDDGTLTLTYVITVANQGVAPVDNAQIVLDLNKTFAGANGFTVDNVRSRSLELNTGFDGSRIADLLTGDKSLAPGSNHSVSVTVSVAPGRNLGPYENGATLVVTSSAGISMTDASADGEDVDPNGDGSAQTDQSPTLVAFEETPALAVQTEVSDPVVIEDDGAGGDSFTTPNARARLSRSRDPGPHLVTVEIAVDNTGDVPLTDLQLELDLESALKGVDRFEVISATSESLDLSNRYDGRARTDLLANNTVLALGAESRVILDILVDPSSDPGPFDLTPTISVSPPSGNPVDIENLEGDALFDFGDRPELTTSAAVLVGPDQAAAGSWTLTYRVEVTNSGSIPLTNVRLMSDLDQVFTSVTDYTAGELSSGVPSATPFLDRAFDGNANIDLLGSNVELSPGETITVDVPLTVVPGPRPGPFLHLPLATAEFEPRPTASRPEDEDYIEPKTSVSSQVHDKNRPSSVTFGDTGGIALSRSVAAAPSGPGGELRVSLTLAVSNTGAGALADLSAELDLTEAIDGEGRTLVSVRSESLNVNPFFDGIGQTSLLARQNRLAARSTAEIEVVLGIDDDSHASPTPPHRVSAMARASNGSIVTAELDPASTPSIKAEPIIGAAKSVLTSPSRQDDGSWAVTYLLRIANLGATRLDGVQATDDLVSALAPVGIIQVTETVGHGLTIDPAYDGGRFGHLLSGDDQLMPGQSGEVEIAVRVDPSESPATALPIPSGVTTSGSASVSGISPDGTVAIDWSQAGTDVDPDRDGDPVGDDVPTVVVFDEPASLSTSVHASDPVANNDGSFTIEYEIQVANTGDEPLTEVAVLGDLRGSLGRASSVRIEGANSPALTLNPAFDAWTDPRLIHSATLAAGEVADLAFTAHIEPGDAGGPFRSPISASAVTPAAMSLGTYDATQFGFPLEAQPKVTANIAGTERDLTLAVDIMNDGTGRTSGPVLVNIDLPAGIVFENEQGRGWTCDEVETSTSCSHVGPLGAIDSLPTLEVDLTRADPSGFGNLIVTTQFHDDEPVGTTVDIAPVAPMDAGHPNPPTPTDKERLAQTVDTGSSSPNTSRTKTLAVIIGVAGFAATATYRARRSGLKAGTGRFCRRDRSDELVEAGSSGTAQDRSRP